ncbi:hypothetical protein BT96DRAFT_1049146 [Gymnopus androsaceus JB14]|uniref:F-box domain-containing protein n=1 Tax=Gymnopus androsaceus JB14 TaxID=1447944 RepID=A0A6A4H8K5_9AGAR|nr:hypothetical protein BT96DRAFT_1049146 [Gymnopus androsaceus JB14]
MYGYERKEPDSLRSQFKSMCYRNTRKVSLNVLYDFKLQDTTHACDLDISLERIIRRGFSRIPVNVDIVVASLHLRRNLFKSPDVAFAGITTTFELCRSRESTPGEVNLNFIQRVLAFPTLELDLQSCSASQKITIIKQMSLSNLRVTVDNASISTKLRSRYGTSSLESSEISQILQLAEKDLEDYETELHELQMQTLSTKFQKKRLKEHSRFCTPSMIVIGAVCTRWHKLVNSCSQLWTRFAVTFCPSDCFISEDRKQDAAMSKVELYLECTRDELLSMYINTGVWEGDLYSLEHPGFELLLAQSHRWHNLSFRGHFSPDSHPGLFANPSIAFPALETVEIDMLDYDGNEAFPAELGLFQHAPRLQSLSFFGCVDMTTQDFSWGQITTLELDTGLLDVYPLIAVCPNLQAIKLRANCKNDAIIYDTPDDPFTSKHVVSFSITGSFTGTSDMIEAILSLFTFPSLRSLELADTAHRRDKTPYQYWPKSLNAVLLYSPYADCPSLTKT